jgi:hypothetical protein
MTTYRISAPNGKTYEIEGPPGATQEQVIQAVLAQSPEAGQAPETSFLGQVGEAFKGVIPGAVGLVEQAAIGASALLPEEQERAARETIAQVAGAAKAPFAPAPGYEGTVGRKFGEAVGSTVPFLGLGPLGLAGRTAAVGLGVGAGAGEARTRAETEGATEEQRSTATALGTLPGALEVFAPFRILKRVPEGEVLTAVDRIKRIAIASGEEAAQEAASGLAQNMIARGVYKPEQELIEGLGEQAAYGGAVGGLAQGLFDLALGRRARGAGTGEPVPPEGQTEIDVVKAKREAERQAAEAAKAAPANTAQSTIDETLGLPINEAYPKLTQAIETLKQERPTNQRNEALKALEAERARRQREDVEQRVANKRGADRFLPADEAAVAAVTPREEFDPTQARREEIARLRQQREDMLVNGKPPAPKSPARRKFDELDARLVEVGGGRWTPPTAPTTEAPPVEEPKVRKVGAPAPLPDVLDSATVAKIGFTRGSIHNMLVGKAPADPEVRDVLQTYLDAKRQEGTLNPKTEAKIDAFLARLPEPAVPTAPAVEPAAPPVAAEPTPAPAVPTPAPAVPEPETPSAVEPVEQPSGAGAPVAGGPAAVTPTEGAGAPEPSGLVPPVEDAGQPAGGETGEPVAVAPTPKPAKRTPAERADLIEQIEQVSGSIPQDEYDAFYAQHTEPDGNRVKSATKSIQAALDLLAKYAKVETPAPAAPTPAPPPAAPTPAPPPAAPTPSVSGRNTPESDALMDEIRELKRQQQALLTKAGRAPAAKSPARKKWDELGRQIEAKKAQWAEMTRVAPAPKPPAPAPAPKPPAPAPAPKPPAPAPAPKPPAPAPAPASRTLPRPQYTQTRFEQADLRNSKEMDAALRGATFDEVVDYAILNARDVLDRAVMVKVKRRVEELTNMGVEFSFRLTDPGAVLKGARGVATTRVGGLGESTKVEVTINGYTSFAENTLRQETLVHELIHAVTVAQINYAPQSSAAIKLNALHKELVSKFKEQDKNGLFELGQKRLFAAALENSKELITYGLVNADFQNWLASTPSPTGGTFLGRFFKLISEVLKLKGKETSALAELMTISENVLDESLVGHIEEANKKYQSFGRQANTTGFPSWILRFGMKPVWIDGPSSNIGLIEGRNSKGNPIYLGVKDSRYTGLDIRGYTGNLFTAEELKKLKDAADAASKSPAPASTTPTAPETEYFDLSPETTPDLVGEKEERTLKNKLDAKFGGNKAIGFRAQAMDLLAGVDYIFTKAYGNRIRDNRGDYNPVFLMSRALDAPRFASEVKEYGTMRRDPTGLLSVETLNYKGEDISYKQVLKDIAAEAKTRGIAPETFKNQVGESLASHREYELMNSPQAAGLDFFLTPQEAATAEQTFQSDAFIKGVSEKLDQIRFAMIDAMVEAGRITPAKAQVWKDAIGYVPFSRIDDFDNLALPQGGGSNAKLAAFKEIAKYKGSQDRQTQNPVENFSKLMDWMVNESMKADAVGRALPEMELLGYAQFVPNRDAIDNNKQGALVDTYVNGQKKVFYVPDPANLAAFIGAPTTDVPAFIRGAQKFSQFLRIGVTATPPFAVKQVFDDITRAYVHSGVKNPTAMLPRILLNFPRNWWNEIKGTQSAGVRELAKSGVVPAYDTIIGGNVKNILEETGLAPRSVGKAILRIMEAGAKASDVAVREAIYNQTLKETGDRALAELRAREIINFSRRGVSKTADYLIRTIPFFNAYARSMDKLLLAAAGNPSAQRSIGATTGYARNLFYKRMGVLTAMGFGYALMMSDDEEYQNLPDYVRDRNWVIPGGKELGFVPAVPLPAELSFFFKAIPERVVQYFKLQGTPEERDAMRVLKELMLNGVDIFSAPNITPQVLKPILENLANYSFFLGRPLESQAQLALDPSERYGTGTSEAMKAASRTLTDIATSTGVEALKVSPIMLENLVRGMFGMSAGIALSVADVMVNPTRTDRPLHQTIAAQLTGASAVMKDPVGMRYLDEIYNLDRSVEQVYNSYRRKLENNPDDAEKFLKDNFGLYVVRSEVRSTMEAIRALNAQARAIDKMTDLSPEERRVIINDLRAQQNDLARDVYRLRRQVTEEQRTMDASR